MTEFVVVPCVLLNGNLEDFRLGVHKITPNKFTKGGNFVKEEKNKDLESMEDICKKLGYALRQQWTFMEQEKVEKIKMLDGMEDIYEKLGYALGQHLIPNGCWHCMIEQHRLDETMPFCRKSLEFEKKELIAFKPFDYLHCYQNEWIDHLWPAECKGFIETLAVEVNGREDYLREI